MHQREKQEKKEQKEMRKRRVAAGLPLPEEEEKASVMDRLLEMLSVVFMMCMAWSAGEVNLHPS